MHRMLLGALIAAVLVAATANPAPAQIVVVLRGAPPVPPMPFLPPPAVGGPFPLVGYPYGTIVPWWGMPSPLWPAYGGFVYPRPYGAALPWLLPAPLWTAPAGLAASGAPWPAASAASSPAPGSRTPSATAPARSSSTAAPVARKAIVFVQGVATTLTTGTFDTLQRRLTASPWGYNADTDFLLFSYTGGSIQDGRWQPNPYPCQATLQDVTTSVDHLYSMLNAYHAANPDTRIVVVAHSLGGVLSTLLIDRLAADPALGSAVEAIITNDSPVGGYSRENVSVVFGKIREEAATAPPELRDAWCGIEQDPFALPIVNQVTAIAADPATPQRNQDRATQTSRHNIRFATRGSDTDCLFNPTVCLGAGTNEAATQHVPGTLGRMYQGLSQIPANCANFFIRCVIASHAYILQEVEPPFGTQDTLTEILELIGPQGAAR